MTIHKYNFFIVTALIAVTVIAITNAAKAPPKKSPSSPPRGSGRSPVRSSPPPPPQKLMYVSPGKATASSPSKSTSATYGQATAYASGKPAGPVPVTQIDLPPGFLNEAYGFGNKKCDCTREWKPQCGEDGNTYGNFCLLECFNAKLDREGACSEETLYSLRDAITDNDDCRCEAILDPVCAKDGNTYPNYCVLQCEGVESDNVGYCKQAKTAIK